MILNLLPLKHRHVPNFVLKRLTDDSEASPIVSNASKYNLGHISRLIVT